MSLETDLIALLQSICPSIHTDFARSVSVTPYLTFQHIGGESLRYADNTAMDKRHPLIQINAWAKTRLEALTMIRQVEGALCASASLQTTPQGESLSTYEADTQLYGSIQRFEIFGAR